MRHRARWFASPYRRAASRTAAPRRSPRRQRVRRQTAGRASGWGCGASCRATRSASRYSCWSGRARLLVAVDAQAVAVHADLERIAEAEERIARQSLAALDTLEQEARAQRLQLQVRRYRGIQIGRNVEWCLHGVFFARKARSYNEESPSLFAAEMGFEFCICQLHASRPPSPVRAATTSCCCSEYSCRRVFPRSLAESIVVIATYSGNQGSNSNDVTAFELLVQGHIRSRLQLIQHRQDQ